MIALMANKRRFAATTLQELRGEAADTRTLQHRPQRLGLLLGRKDRAAHKPRQIRAFAEQTIEAIEIGLDGVEVPFVARQLKQGGRVAARHPGNDVAFALHAARFQLRPFLGLARNLMRMRKPLKCKWDFILGESSAGAPQNPQENLRGC